MNRIAKMLANRGLGEEEQDEFHYPEYTKGCWGKLSHSKCWICKVRYPLRILKIAKRIRKQE